MVLSKEKLEKAGLAKKHFWIAVSVIIGTSIGAGILGLPYVAAQAGFFVTAGYIVAIGLIILFVNLYLGEISLRTKGNHQIAGYARKYFGKKGRMLVEFATIFGLYAAIVAYIFGISESLSVLFFQNADYTIYIGIFVGLIMCGLFYRGLEALKRFEKIGVLIILVLIVVIFFIFSGDIKYENIIYSDFTKIFLPFGVVLFALNSFHAVPEARIILNNNEKHLKKAIIVGMVIAVVSYLLFSLVVTGSLGENTPEIATLALGSIFIVLGIFTMFTSYLSLGNALMEDFMFDDRLGKKQSLFFAGVVPIFIFLFVKSFEFFSFTRILSIGGIVSGGLVSILIILMVGYAKSTGDRKPEYSIPLNRFASFLLVLIFSVGILSRFI